MKSWLRARKNELAPSVTRSDSPPLVNIERVPAAQAQHGWDALMTESAAESVEGPGPLVSVPPASEPRPAHHDPAQPPRLDAKPTTHDLIESTAVAIYASPMAHRQRIIVRSEHYFRLALESWEQLRACHFKASQNFSLAEWMHIHALLLYGRIQAVERLFSRGSVTENNRIELSEDAAVFEPLSTIINAIGIVQDGETGTTYIPGAVFPTESQSPLTYTASEMQSIIDGTMYDWQRSWKRVLEARHKRDTKYTQYVLARSPSELLSAIRAKSEILADRQELSKRSSKVLTDYKTELDQLQELLEEARNAKDYTIRPPCVRVYDQAEEEDPADDVLRADDARQGSTRQGSARQGSSRQDDARKAHPRRPDIVPANALPPGQRSASARILDPRQRANESPEASATTESRQAEPAPRSSILGDIFEMSAGEPAEPVAPTDGTELPDSMRLRLPPRSALRRGTSSATRSTSNAPPTGPADGSLMDMSNDSDVTLRGDSPGAKEEGLRPTSASSPRRSAGVSRESPKRDHRVQPEAADASDCHVHFDTRIWDEYGSFVSALRATKLTKFGTLKKERDGNYAWMLPVRFAEDSAPLSTPAMQPFSQSPRPRPAPGRTQRLQLRLPRASIPRTEQVIALLLQTGSASAETSGWHLETNVELDMRKFVLDYVNTGIFDDRVI